MRKAIFIDKDGTLIPDIPYNVDPDKIIFEDGVIESLRNFKRYGYTLIMVTNQSGIAKGFFSMEALSNLFVSLQNRLALQNVALDAIYFCPHYPCGIVDKYVLDCTCRKPKPGMILKAASEWNIDLKQSWMIGDILNDVEAGARAGCSTILIDNGNETEWLTGEYRKPSHTAKRFAEAADVILDKRLIENES
ncbi:MAG TPA: HAD family hydrolase [Ohtaekwangia sp.]|nr:HAD family hydrolase [Ohtaekwangia sp.]